MDRPHRHSWCAEPAAGHLAGGYAAVAVAGLHELIRPLKPLTAFLGAAAGAAGAIWQPRSCSVQHYLQCAAVRPASNGGISKISRSGAMSRRLGGKQPARPISAPPASGGGSGGGGGSSVTPRSAALPWPTPTHMVMKTSPRTSSSVPRTMYGTAERWPLCEAVRMTAILRKIRRDSDHGTPQQGRGFPRCGGRDRSPLRRPSPAAASVSANWDCGCSQESSRLVSGQPDGRDAQAGRGTAALQHARWDLAALILFRCRGRLTA